MDRSLIFRGQSHRIPASLGLGSKTRRARPESRVNIHQSLGELLRSCRRTLMPERRGARASS